MAQAKAESRFTSLQLKAREAARTRDAFRLTLEVRYGAGNVCYASVKERRELDRLKARTDKAERAFFDFLQSIAARDFTSGFPAAWLRDSLTFADAITRDQMSTIPPAAWGYTDRDMRAFTGPVTTEAA